MTKKILIQSDLPAEAPDRAELPLAVPNGGQDYLYKTPRGYPVKELSYSMHNEYAESPAKFYWKRVMGMREKYTWATAEFGHALQAAVQANLGHNSDPVAVFQSEWTVRGKKENLKYSPTTSFEKLLEQGVGLMSTFMKQREAGLYNTFKNLKFPDMKKGGALVMMEPTTGEFYQSIPDIIGEDDKGPFVCDIKALDKPVATDTPGLIVSDMQLRTQAALTGINRVVLWVFARTAKNPPAPSVAEVTASVVKSMYQPGGVVPVEYVLDALRRILGMTIEDAGKALNITNPKEMVKEFKAIRKNPTDEQRKALEGLDNAVAQLAEARAPQYNIAWIEGTMKRSWALAAVKDQLLAVADIKAGHFPCRCSVRYPNDTVHTCPYRGLCLLQATENPTKEQIEEWNRITVENLEGWDTESLRDL